MYNVSKYIIMYFSMALPFLFLLYYVVKRAVRDGILEAEKFKKNKN